MKYDKNSIQQDVRNYLILNKDVLSSLASSIKLEYETKRALFVQFLPDFETERNSRLRSMIIDEVTSRFGCDLELVEEVLGDVDVYTYLFGEK